MIVSRQEIYLKTILISTFCVAICQGGKYQMHFPPANTICKFVNQFSFIISASNETGPYLQQNLKIDYLISIS